MVIQDQHLRGYRGILSVVCGHGSPSVTGVKGWKDGETGVLQDCELWETLEKLGICL